MYIVRLFSKFKISAIDCKLPPPITGAGPVEADPVGADPDAVVLAFFILYLSSRTIGNAFADLTKNALESVEILFVGTR